MWSCVSNVSIYRNEEYVYTLYRGTLTRAHILYMKCKAVHKKVHTNSIITLTIVPIFKHEKTHHKSQK